MHSDGIWNDLNLRFLSKTMSLKHALWRYFKLRLNNWKRGRLRVHSETTGNDISNCNENQSADSTFWAGFLMFFSYYTFFIFLLSRKSCRPGPSSPTRSYASGIRCCMKGNVEKYCWIYFTSWIKVLLLLL